MLSSATSGRSWRTPSYCLSFVNREPLFANFQRVQGMTVGAPTATASIAPGGVCEGAGAVA
jgi:hypothetical protein